MARDDATGWIFESVQLGLGQLSTPGAQYISTSPCDATVPTGGTITTFLPQITPHLEIPDIYTPYIIYV